MRANDARQQNKCFAMASHLGRKRNDPGQNSWNFHNGDVVGATKRILARQLDNEVQRFVGNLGEWVSRVESYRHQKWIDLTFKIISNPFLLNQISVCMRKNFDAFFL